MEKDKRESKEVGDRSKRVAKPVLQESERKFRQVIEASPVPMVISDRNGNTEFVNRKFVDLFGYTLKELPTVEDWWPLAYPDEEYRREVRERWESAVKKAMKEKSEMEPLETKVTCKDGSVRHVLFRFSPVDDRNLVVLDDITERKQAEESLKESEGKFETFSENVPGVVCIYDLYPDGHRETVYVGPGLEQLLGKATADRIGNSVEEFFKLIHPDDLAKLHNAADEARETGQVLDQEYRVRIDSENYVWVRSVNQASPRENGIVRWSGQVLDVTERKRGEKEMREMSEAAMQLVDFPPERDMYDFICEKVKQFVDGGIVAVNSIDLENDTLQVRKVLGIGEAKLKMIDKLLGRKTTSISLSGIFQEAKEALTSGKLAKVEGGLYTVFFQKFPKTVCQQIEKVVGIKGIYSIGLRRKGKLLGSVTILASKNSRVNKNVIETFVNQASIALERKQAEEALENAAAGWRTTFDSARDLIMVLDPHFKITRANLATAKFLGRSVNELPGKTCYQLVHGTDAPPDWCPIEKMRQTKKREEAEFYLPEKDVWLSVSADPVVDEQGKLISAVHIVRDITERKRAEEAVEKERQRLFSVLDVMPAFVYLQAPDYSVPYVNRRFREMFGDPGDRPCYEVFHGRKEPCDPCITLRVLETRAPQTWEWTSKDGRTYMIYEDLFPGTEGEDLVLEIGVDITQRKRAEEALYESERELRLRNQINEIFLTTGDDKTYGAVLNVVRETLNSEFGTFGYFREDGAFVTPAITREIYWDKCQVPDKGIIFEKGTFRGVWAEALKQNKILYSNKGPFNTPEGHIPVRNTIVAPVIYRNKIISAIHLANKPTDYDEKDKVLLGMIADHMAPVLYARIERDEREKERRRVEESLKESEGKFRVLTEQSLLGVVIIQSGFVKYVNRTASAITEYSIEEALEWKQNDFGKLFHPDDREFVIEQARKKQEGDKDVVAHYSYRIITKSGKVIWVDQYSKTITFDGKTADFITLVDITEQKKAEDGLAESEEKYRKLFETETDAIMVFDAQTRQFVDVNEAAVSLYGYSREEFLKLKQADVTAEPDESEVSIEQTLGGELTRIPVRYHKKKDGTIFPVEISASSFVLKGRKVLCGVIRDITERKALQSQLIQSEKLAAVGTLAYGIAHEFNNILAGMMVNAELGGSLTDNPEIKECFDSIVENTGRGSSITNSLLAVAGERREKKELLDLTRPLENILSFSRRELEKANIKVVEDFRPIPEILCDPGQFSEVYLNIINNARDAMQPEGGTLTVSVRPYKGNIRIVFKDTGCGIPDEIKNKIFDPFVTTKGALGKSEVPGTGLGLFLTYGIVNSYRGRIEVESETGKGTTFTILIPVSRNLPSEAPPKMEAVPPGKIDRQLNILLIDDEKTICNVLKRFLQSKGHKVTASLEGSEGFEHFKKDKFDVVLSDITMPGMDGIELIKLMREKDKDSKIIAITGHVQQQKLDEAKDAGAQEVLIKPFRNAELYETIARLLLETARKDHSGTGTKHKDQNLT